MPSAPAAIDGDDPGVCESWRHRLRRRRPTASRGAGADAAARSIRRASSRRAAAASGSRPSPPARSSSSSCCARPPSAAHDGGDRAGATGSRRALRSGKELPRADAGRASADDGRPQAVGAAALLRPGGPLSTERPAGLLAAQPRRRQATTASSAAAERGGALYLLAKGGRAALLRLPIADIEQELAA